MDITTLKDDLPDEKYTALVEFVEKIEGQRDAAKNESINRRQTLKKENAELTKFKENVIDELGIEETDDTTVDDILDAVKAAQKSGVDGKATYETKIRRLQTDLESRDAELKELRASTAKTKRRDAIRKAIKGVDFNDEEVVTLLLEQRIKEDEGEFFYENGKGGLVSLDEAAKLIATDKPHLVASQGSGGSGFKHHGADGKEKKFEELTEAERREIFDKNPEKYRQMRKVSNG